jgi:hypothetical protein
MQSLDKMCQVLSAEPPTLQDPILRLTYVPSPPVFTIRDIVSSITSSNNPPFRVMIHKPPSLDDRARLVQVKEKRNLLYRMGFSLVIAIPTFIIGVVFMSLVSSKNHIRNFLMEPMWMGNASRIQWSLFFLATPVMFYSAGGFHRRSMKEIHALWRRGSRTPVWKRFLRFGSMNLLVCAFSFHLFKQVNCLRYVRYRQESRWHISLPLFYLSSQCRHHHLRIIMLIPQHILTPSSS